jgi:hypothetical protein
LSEAAIDLPAQEQANRTTKRTANRGAGGAKNKISHRASFSAIPEDAALFAEPRWQPPSDHLADRDVGMD